MRLQEFVSRLGWQSLLFSDIFSFFENYQKFNCHKHRHSDLIETDCVLKHSQESLHTNKQEAVQKTYENEVHQHTQEPEKRFHLQLSSKQAQLTLTHCK